MVESFPRVLSLLRQEKKVSQKEAAAMLGVSQALLSHYENGLREPGLAFVANAATYYGVTADYLLGLSMERNGEVVKADELPDASRDKDNRLRGSAKILLNKRLLLNSISVLYDVIGKMSSRELVDEVSDYMSAAVYKMFRYIYMAGGENPDGMFNTPEELFSEAADAEMKRNEFRVRGRVKNIKVASLVEGDEIRPVDLSHDALKSEYQTYSQSLLALLHGVGQKLEKYL